ncbi:hypothetical protein [Membranihabitans maritimus]|uniref:hypothetical protein n=1 Tax=Membranihabitans maritimus TaxID=2904244 RepID=UPI001F176175|nr:hypothetical protein [Membranihabitans maritimus]
MKSGSLNIIMWIIAFIGLGLTIIPSFLLFSGGIDSSACKTLMAVGMVVWFAARISVKNQ